MKLSLIDKIQLKLIYTSCKKMGLEYVAGHLIAPALLHENAIVFDLGGNQGFFSNEMVAKYSCISYCIEPDSNMFDKIPVNSKIKKYNLAVTGTDGQMDFILSDNSEANSFNPVLASLWGKGKTINVKTSSLQSFQKEVGVSKIDLLKIDIEGSEIPVLESLSNEALFKIPQIAIEFHEFLDEALEKDTINAIKRLQSLGFYMIVYSAKKFSDVLFLNSRFIHLKGQQRFWYFVHNIFRHKGSMGLR